MSIINQNRAINIAKFIMSLLLTLTAQSEAWGAVTVTIDNLKYSIDTTKGTASVTGLATTSTTIENLIIPDAIEYNNASYTVTTIASNAFKDKGSKLSGTLVLPKNLVKIGDYAFYNCKNFTGELKFPNTLTTIGKYAFNKCSGFTGTLKFPPLLTSLPATGVTFGDCTGFTGLELHNDMTTLGSHTFWNCTGFTGTLIIPGSIMTIWAQTFQNCGFTKVIIKEGSTRIVFGAFSRCKNLLEIEIPSTMTLIGSGVLAYCESLQSVICKATTPPNHDMYASGGYGEENQYSPIFANNGTSESNSLYKKIWLTVPKESIPTYKKTVEWRALNFTDGIEDYPTEITLNPASIQLEIEQESVIAVHLTPNYIMDESVEWTTSDESIATVDENGKVTAVAVGKATITATTANGLSASCEVTVTTSTTTSIDSIVEDTDTTVDIYNLQGICIHRKASVDNVKTLAPGLYIIGGKKVLVK